MATSMVKNAVPPVVVVLGATGAGKSKLAIELGKRFQGEIISADSMQVYKGLDVITNKVTPEEEDGVPHHFLGIIHPLSRFTIVDFRDKAVPVIDSLLNRGKMPVIVGGTNYYIEALLWRVLIQQEPHCLSSSEGLLLKDGDNSDYIKLPKMCLKDVINQSKGCYQNDRKAASSQMNLKSSIDDQTSSEQFSGESRDQTVIYSELSRTLSQIASNGGRKEEDGKCKIGAHSGKINDDERQSEELLSTRHKEEGETSLVAGKEDKGDRIHASSSAQLSGDEISQGLITSEGGRTDVEESACWRRCVQSDDGLGQLELGEVSQSGANFKGINSERDSLRDNFDDELTSLVNEKGDRTIDETSCGLSYVKESAGEDGFDMIDVEGSSSAALHRILTHVDPEMALKLHQNDKRKIVRSLQVFQQHGRPHSEMLKAQRHQEGGGPLGGPLRYRNLCIFWIQTDQEVLDKRLEKRVETMMEAGLVEELSNFHKDYNQRRLQNESKEELYVHGIFQSIGFKEFHPYLILPEEEKETDHGKKLLLDGIERLKVVTKQYARKQLKWIRKRFLKRPGDYVPDVYGVDSTFPEEWDDAVLKPAVEILESILQGRVPAQSPLKKEDPDFLPSQVTTHVCDVCDGRTFVGPQQWQGHLNSRRHKKRAAQAKKRHLYQEWEQERERKAKKGSTEAGTD